MSIGLIGRRIASIASRSLVRALVPLGLALAIASAVEAQTCYATKNGLTITSASGWVPLSDPSCQAKTGGSNGLIGATVAASGGCSKAYVGAAQVAILNRLNGGQGLDTVRVGPGATLVFKDENFVTRRTPGGLRVSAIVVEGTVAPGADGDPESDQRTVTPGSLIVGTPQCPIGTDNPANTVALTFWANAGASQVGSALSDPNPFAPCNPAVQTNGICEDGFGVKVVAVGRGGLLSMYGARGVPATGVSWTHLSAPVLKLNAVNAIAVQDAVDWRPNDWIAIASTDFSEFRAEAVQVSQVSSGGQQITLATNLMHAHFGGNATFSDNFGVDQRAEVALLTRNIRLTSDVTDGYNTAAPEGRAAVLGGNLIVRRYFGGVALEGVEFEKFGQGGVRGSYPIHFHLTVDTPTLTKAPQPAGFPTSPALWTAPTIALVNANSVHHSYTRCVALHATNGLSVTNNVCFRNIGHSYFFEDGVELNNRLERNLAVGAMMAVFTPNLPNIYFDGDLMPAQMRNGAYVGTQVPRIMPTDGSTPSAFWVTNPANSIVGNNAAGCHGQGRGFWYVPTSGGSGLSKEWYEGMPYSHQTNPNTGSPLQYDDIQANSTPVQLFSSNRAHACYTGLDVSTEDFIDDFGDPTNTYPPSAGGYPGATNNPVLVANFLPVSPSNQKIGGGRDVLNYWDAFRADRIRNRGAWLRPNFNHLDASTFATTIRGATVVSSGSADGSPPGIWSAITNSTFVGRTNNRIEEFGPEPDCVSPTTNNTQCNEANIVQVYGNQGSQGATATSQAGVGFPNSRNYGMFGVMFYDGPARLENNHFENFNVDPQFTDTNVTGWLAGPGEARYPGDAAIGWFDAGNQQSYAGTQHIFGTTWTNVDLRHLIFTERSGRYVQLGGLQDGDQDTVIRDRDGTLTAYQVAGAVTGDERYPFVLNNIPFHRTPNTQDECYSAANLDTVGEYFVGGQLKPWPSGLVSPHRIATLVLDVLNTGSEAANPYAPIPGSGALPSNLTYTPCANSTCTGTGDPPNAVIVLKDQEIHYQSGLPTGELTFERATPNIDAGLGFLSWISSLTYPPGSQTSLNQGYEPAVPYDPTNSASLAVAPVIPQFGLYLQGRVNRVIPGPGGQVNTPTNFEPKVTDGLSYTVHFPTFGTPSALALALMDADVSASDPFSVRVGVCYANYKPGTSYASAPFNVIRRNYYFAGNGGYAPAPGSMGYGAVPWTQCPADSANCPTAGTALTPLNIPTDCATAKACVAKLALPANANAYFFDAATGLLFLNVQQLPSEDRLTPLNSQAAYSPAGTCSQSNGTVVDGSTEENQQVCQSPSGSAAGAPGGDLFWVCPKQGCPYYTIQVADPSYTPDHGTPSPATCPGAYPTYFVNFSTTKAVNDTLTPATGLPVGDACVVSGTPQQATLKPWFGPQPSPPSADRSIRGIRRQGDHSH